MYEENKENTDSYFDTFVEQASLVPIKIKSNLNLIKDLDEKINGN
jgi:hypothetical protein